MGSNYHTPWADSTSEFEDSSLNALPSSLDKAITYANKRPIVHCDGDIAWVSGTLSWSSTIRIIFNREDGQAIENTVSVGSIALSDNQFAYVTLSETNGAVLSVLAATVTTGAASNFLALGIFVLAYRNTTSDDIVLCGLPTKPHYIQEEGSSLPRRPKLNFSGASVTAADDSGNNATKVTFRNGLPDSSIVAYSATISIDLDSYNLADITLTGNPTINFTGGVDGQAVIIRLRQDGTGSRTVTWGSMARFSVDAPSPILSTAPDALDYLVFRINEEESVAKYDFMAINRGF